MGGSPHGAYHWNQVSRGGTVDLHFTQYDTHRAAQLHFRMRAYSAALGMDMVGVYHWNQVSRGGTVDVHFTQFDTYSAAWLHCRMRAYSAALGMDLVVTSGLSD